jgi:hypothetical protein
MALAYIQPKIASLKPTTPMATTPNTRKENPTDI